MFSFTADHGRSSTNPENFWKISNEQVTSLITGTAFVDHVSFRYLSKHPTLRPHMRMILVEWLVSLQQRFGLLQETLLMGVSVLDRFMSNTSYEVSRNKFQLVGR